MSKYFTDKDENLITDITYTLEYSHAENLEIWKDYLSVEENWETIKKEKRNNLTLENLKQFLLYRNIKYSPYDLMQIKNLDFYFQLTGPQDVNVGVAPPSDRTVIVVRRIVNLNGSEAVVKFQLFRPE